MRPHHVLPVSNACPFPGVIALADGIKNNGALVTVTINKFALPVQDIKTKMELDLSGKGLGVEDAIVIAALVPLNVSRAKRLRCCLLILLLYYRQGGVSIS